MLNRLHQHTTLPLFVSSFQCVRSTLRTLRLTNNVHPFRGIRLRDRNPYSHANFQPPWSTRCRMHARSSQGSAPSNPGQASRSVESSRRRISVLSVLLLIIGATISIPTTIFMLLGHLLPNRTQRNLWLLKLWLRLTISLSGISVSATGLSTYTHNRGPVMLVSNRQSAVDVAAIVSTFPEPLRFIVPERALRVPILGWMLSLAGCVSLPADRRKAAETLSKEIGHADSPLLVFPEGRPGTDGSVGKFLSPPFKAALSHGASIIPVSVSGGWEICAGNLIPTKWGAISVGVHDPLSVTEGMTDKEVTTKAFEKVKEGLERARARV